MYDNRLRRTSAQILFFVLILSLIPALSFAQSSSFRAQARYYTALDEFEEGDFLKAVQSAKESKRILSGTNVLIQYVHIMAAYEAGRYTEAFEEIERFFQIIEGDVTPVNFRRGAQELTDDELEDILQIFDQVEASVVNRVEDRSEIEGRVESSLHEIARLLTSTNSFETRGTTSDGYTMKGEFLRFEFTVRGRFPVYRIDTLERRGFDGVRENFTEGFEADIVQSLSDIEIKATTKEDIMSETRIPAIYVKFTFSSPVRGFYRGVEVEMSSMTITVPQQFYGNRNILRDLTDAADNLEAALSDYRSL